MPLRHSLLLALVLALGAVAGCAVGDDGITPRGDGSPSSFDSGPQIDAGRLDSGADPPGTDAGPDDVCTPPCNGTDQCVAGRCVATGTDVDGDGFPAAVDCDDNDPAVGAAAERDCSSSCGAGVERCMDGAWGTCSAPTTCDCTEGTPPRSLDCAMCGQIRQVCVSGNWVDDGGCMGQGACMPGATETGAPCGCGTQRRTCGSNCQWGTFECVGGGSGQCTPGQTDTMNGVACGNCGTMTRTRTCNSSTCAWNAWQDGTCTGQGVCAPGATRGGCDMGSSGAATTCGVETCTSACSWGSCQLAPGAQCMSNSGTSFQCCTPSGGGAGWQFCSSSTCRWFDCASHSCG